MTQKKTTATDPYYNTFTDSIDAAKELLRVAPVVHSNEWPGVNISKAPEMATHEVLNFSFEMPSTDHDLETLQRDIQPNLPWADDHFAERVNGKPINPGEEWKRWPWGNNAQKFLDSNGQFNHNYMERYWPKFANERGTLLPLPRQGIRFEYGDLSDVVELLVRDPHTRQAYLPVFFPEDTGGRNGRAPCTLGYHFIMRNQELHVVYYIRSCDFLRHFRDDIYLTVRLQHWVLAMCRNAALTGNAKVYPPGWLDVRAGSFTMHITSLHLFRNDYRTVMA